MISLLQRVKHASVSISGDVVAQIHQGLLVFTAIETNDTQQNCDKMCQRLLGYRIFSDENGLMNKSVCDTHGEVLVVSQFTLAANTSKGMRPSFTPCAEPEQANHLYQYFIDKLNKHYTRVFSGVFSAKMEVTLCNDGPVTFLLKS